MIPIKDLTFVRNSLSVLIAILGLVWLWATKVQHWSKDYIEPTLVVVGSLIALCQFLMLRWNREDSINSQSEGYNIPNTKENRDLLSKAKEAIGKAQPEWALRHLTNLNLQKVNDTVSLLSARLAKHQQSNIQGILSNDDKDRTLNRINADILALITVLDSEMKTSAVLDNTIKEYLTKRYEKRLSQKLAGRQPVNLRRLITTEGTSEETSAAFVPYSGDEIKEHIAQTFQEAHGRLLITGVPGAGKTTLLLQLELALLKTETDALPVILNLATWKKEYITLDTWLKEILPAELGVSNRFAADILLQNRLILLFDGFDEVKEDNRESCLEAIGRYGADAKRQFVITSRIEEYKDVAKDAPVYLQIEVGALTIEQIETELERVGYDQPEAKPLLQAIRQDDILRESVKVPFYFNTLQLLFASGKRLSDLRFTSTTVVGRQAEMIERFAAFELAGIPDKSYTSTQSKNWLAFLAFKMESRNLVVFELEELQYVWWNWSTRELFVAGIIEGFVVNVAPNLILVPFAIFVLNFGYGLIFLLVFSLLTGIISSLLNIFHRFTCSIVVRNSIFWSWQLFLNNILEQKYTFLGLLGLILVNAIIPRGYQFDWSKNIYIILYAVLTFCIYSGFGNYSVKKHIIQISHPYQRFKSSNNVLHFSIIQHYHLLYLLSSKRLLPYNLVAFLNSMTQQNILESDGATWRFRHRLVRDYFAYMYEIEPSDYESLQEKGLIFSHKNEYNKAIEYYNQAICIKPDFSRGHNNLGFLFIKSGDIEKAEKSLQRASALGSLDTGNMNLGHVYLIKGDKNTAILHYQTSLNNFKRKGKFWEGMNDDLQYLTQYGITKEYYRSILEEIKGSENSK
jgi:hypothetical protein